VGEATLRRSRVRQGAATAALRGRIGVAERAANPVEHLLALQRQAGNRAVVALLGGRTPQTSLQRAPTTHPENPPVTDLHPTGTMSDREWEDTYKAAKQAGTVDAYRPLFRDIAQTAGMDKLPGFDLSTLPATDGKTAKPGLNITADASGDPGHTAWVDKDGTWGVRLNLSAKPSEVSVGVILTPRALTADKATSLGTVRHEMVHAKHHVMVLDAVRQWRKSAGKSGFDEWLTDQVKLKKMSKLENALIGKVSKDANADTEVLGYVEGFMNVFHRRAPTFDLGRLSFFELLGAVRTSKLDTWRQADPAVQDEAMARLQEYYKTLDADHQKLWKDLLDDRKTKLPAKDTANEKDFLARLSVFVV
jgi:hypothetical protein